MIDKDLQGEKEDSGNCQWKLKEVMHQLLMFLLHMKMERMSAIHPQISMRLVCVFGASMEVPHTCSNHEIGESIPES